MTQEQRARLRQAQREDDIRHVLSTPHGRRFYWRVISELGDIHGLALDADPRTAAVVEGRRAVGVSLYQEAQRIDADLHLAMVTEALEQQREDAILARKDEAEE